MDSSGIPQPYGNSNNNCQQQQFTGGFLNSTTAAMLAAATARGNNISDHYGKIQSYPLIYLSDPSKLTYFKSVLGNFTKKINVYFSLF